MILEVTAKVKLIFGEHILVNAYYIPDDLFESVQLYLSKYVFDGTNSDIIVEYKKSVESGMIKGVEISRLKAIERMPFMLFDGKNLFLN